MYIIDEKYFTGKYLIANINESQSGDKEFLIQLIDTEIRLFMQNLLGLELFNEFDSFMIDGVLTSEAPQKWLDLVNGVEYDGKKWNGLAYKIGEHVKSLFTNYIWVKYFIDKSRIDGNLNANIIDPKNAKLGNAANKFYPIWNEFVAMVAYMPEGDFVSLNQFLMDKREDYPTANYVFVDFENRFL
jgi:hypothetical protein